jgi:hypothetical protein
MADTVVVAVVSEAEALITFELVAVMAVFELATQAMGSKWLLLVRPAMVEIHVHSGGCEGI